MGCDSGGFVLVLPVAFVMVTEEVEGKDGRRRESWTSFLIKVLHSIEVLVPTNQTINYKFLFSTVIL